MISRQLVLVVTALTAGSTVMCAANVDSFFDVFTELSFETRHHSQAVAYTHGMARLTSITGDNTFAFVDSLTFEGQYDADHRFISWVANAHILHGRWDGAYGDGKEPQHWKDNRDFPEHYCGADVVLEVQFSVRNDEGQDIDKLSEQLLGKLEKADAENPVSEEDRERLGITSINAMSADAKRAATFVRGWLYGYDGFPSTARAIIRRGKIRKRCTVGYSL